jgi:hypothetical protein
MTGRRSFLGGVGAFLAGLFGARAGAAPWPYDPTVADRSRRGACMARLYRFDPESGDFHEIGRLGARPGDRCVMLGLDGQRLWRAEAFTVGEKGVVGDPLDGEPAVYVEGPMVSLFDRGTLPE